MSKAISLMKLTKNQLLELYMEAQHKINRISLAIMDDNHDHETFFNEVDKIMKDIKGVKRRIDCMTCKHFDRWSDSCPFCQYEYDKDTDCEQRPYAGVVEK